MSRYKGRNWKSRNERDAEDLGKGVIVLVILFLIMGC